MKAEAEAALRQLLALNPEHEQAWNQLCGLLRRQRRTAAAEACSRQAVSLQPSCGLHWVNLGNCLSDQQRWVEAAEAFQQAIALNQHDALAYNNLSVVLLKQRRAIEAEANARRAVEINESSAEFQSNLGACLFELRRWSDAVKAFEDAATLAPENGAVWGNVAAAKQQLGLLTEAQVAFERSLSQAPADINTKVNYASLLTQRGQIQAACSMLQGILGEHPQCVQAWLASGRALHAAGELTRAIAVGRRAYELAPGQFEVRYGLAQMLIDNWELEEAEHLVRGILAEDDTAAEVWGLLGTVFEKQGRQAEAVEALRRSVEIQANAQTHSFLLLCLQYSGDSETMLDAHREWDTRYGRSVLTPSCEPAHARGSDERLRIGFVSADLRLHPIGFLALRVVESLDKGRCCTVCYHDSFREDVFTSRFRSASDLWRVTYGHSTDEIVGLICRDEIDILIDLMGHTGTRLSVFACRPAPMQVTWLGYVGTTGLSAMDFLLADRFHVREGEEVHYTETVLRLPNGYACYSPVEVVPDVALLPALSAGHFTYGCFNNPAKYSPQILDAWAQILHGQPTARLLLKYHGLDQKNVSLRLRRLFEQRGIDLNRVLIEGHSPHNEMLAAYSRVDLALDTQPYSGGLTTCEAMWMGVPVVTYPGKSFAGRHSTSHLSNAGYPQFIATDVKAYIELAVEWADGLDALALIRSQMREHVRSSSLCDAPTFANDFLNVLQHAWQQR